MEQKENSKPISSISKIGHAISRNQLSICLRLSILYERHKAKYIFFRAN